MDNHLMDLLNHGQAFTLDGKWIDLQQVLATNRKRRDVLEYDGTFELVPALRKKPRKA